MNKMMFIIMFNTVGVLLTAVAALLCFAPSRWKALQDKRWPGPIIHEDDASQPTWLYRFSGLMMMSIGVFILVLGDYILLR